MLKTLRMAPLVLAQRRTADKRTRDHRIVSLGYLALAWLLAMASLVRGVTALLSHYGLGVLQAVCLLGLAVYVAHEYVRAWPEEVTP